VTLALETGTYVAAGVADEPASATAGLAILDHETVEGRLVVLSGFHRRRKADKFGLAEPRSIVRAPQWCHAGTSRRRRKARGK
jgi:hypothetical protein